MHAIAPGETPIYLQVVPLGMDFKYIVKMQDTEKERADKGWLPDVSPGIEVRPDRASAGLGVYATAPFKAGDRLGFFTGRATSIRSRMSLQFGQDLFIEPGMQDPFRNLNHACSPSAVFRGRDLHAAQDLSPGDPVTIDYTLHEERMAAPFPCKCGDPACLLEIQGWAFLSKNQKKVRASIAGEWLQVPSRNL